MDFKVQAGDLDIHSTLVGRAADDIQQSRQYAQGNTTVGISNEGLIELIVGAHSAVTEDVQSTLVNRPGFVRHSIRFGTARSR